MNIGDVYRGNYNWKLIVVVSSNDEATQYWPNEREQKIKLEKISLSDDYTKLYSGNGPEVRDKVQVRIGDVFEDGCGTYLVAGQDKIISLGCLERLIYTSPKDMIGIPRIVQGEGPVVGEG